MSTDPVLPAVHSPSGLLHLAPDDTLWSIFQYPDSDRLLILRYDAQDRALPDWHLDQAGYDDYRARHPQIGLPDLGAPSEPESTPAGEPGTAEVETRHIAHAGSWSATSVEPDWCEVCAEPVPFDSHADLSDPVRASPNVKARGTPVYAISHIGRGVQGSVGEGLESGTSGASGHVQILSGQNDVKVNGLMVGRHGSQALINCDAQGCGGALAQLQVSFKPTSAIDQVGRELSMTTAELQQRMAQYREGQAAANARADAIDRQIAELRRQADQASSWNPLNAERRAIARQIRSLQASQRSAASSALWYGEQALRIVERMHPENIGMPGNSATPDPQEARELARRQADIERGWAVIDARRRGFGGALASMAGAPPELADAVNSFTTFGRRQNLRPVAQPVRPRRRHQPAPAPAATQAPAPQQPVQPVQPGQPRPAPPPAQKLTPARRTAAPPPRPGVYVQPPPRIPRIKVRCFKKNRTGSPVEYDRQLAGQERGLNEMSVKDYLEGRARYKEIGRKGTGAAQEAARAEYAKELTLRFKNELLKQGVVGVQAQQQAAALTVARMKTLAALHEPDMIAGGKDVVTSMGDRSVNSSIGSQWKDRVEALDAAALKVPEDERANTKMNAQLVRCP